MKTLCSTNFLLILKISSVKKKKSFKYLNPNEYEDIFIFGRHLVDILSHPPQKNNKVAHDLL